MAEITVAYVRKLVRRHHTLVMAYSRVLARKQRASAEIRTARRKERLRLRRAMRDVRAELMGYLTSIYLDDE